MRIFVTAPDETGTMRKTRLTLVDCNTTNDLLKRLSSLCNTHPRWIIAKIKQDIFNIRIIQGWSLDIYPLKQGSQIIVQNIPQPTKNSTEINSSPKLQKIDEQLELEIQDNNSTNGVADQKLSFNSESNDYDWTKYFEQSLQEFLDAVRKNQIEKAANILKSEPSDCTDEKIINKIMPKKVNFLLNQSGQCGRTALHWAVQQNNLDMVQFLLIKTSNPNTVSIDHYTPLQLSIVLKASSIFQTLMSHPKIQLNKVTKKGTALHLCFEYSVINYAQRLIDHGADPEIQNNQGVSSIDVYKKLNLKGIRLKNHQGNVQELPFILRGTINRVSSFTSRLKERLLVVNPFANEFVLFQDKKAEQNIDLDSIKQINYIKNKSWAMKKQYYYFQIKYNGQQIIFCIVHDKIGVSWVENLRKCVNFCRKKHHLQKYPQNLQLVMILDDKKNDIKVHRRKKTSKSSQQASRFSKQLSRISIFDLVPQQQQKEQITNQVKIGTKKQSQNQIQQSQNLNQSALFPIQSSAIQENGYNNDRESTLVGSILRTSIFSKYINKAETTQNMMQEKSRPIVCFKDFQVLRQLGIGSFGKVFLARHRREQKLYALKVLNKKKLIAKKQIKYAVGEANILKKVESPFIIKLYYSFQTPTNLYIAIDYCSNGDLSQKIIQNDQCLCEKVCRFFIAQVILAIQYLHKNNIIYRDLKPENILIGQDGYIRLVDFNLSRQNHFSTSFCGSPAYLSPQMLEKKGVGPQADIYGIGCVLYEMMVGQPPFFDENIDSLYDKIKNSRLKFPASISKTAKSLISSLLQRNIKKRIGVKDMKQIKNHEFFEGFEWKKLEKLQMKVPQQLQFKNSDNLGLIVIQEHGLQDSDYENSSAMINRIKNFTFARESEFQQKVQLQYI